MATLFEILGEGTYVEMMKAVGLRPEPEQTHPYAKCTSPSRCTEHRRVYRRLLKAQREAVIKVSKVSVAETALRLLAEEAPKLTEDRVTELARVARIDPNPTRLPSVTVNEALQTVARRALYVGGKA